LLAQSLSFSFFQFGVELRGHMSSSLQRTWVERCNEKAVFTYNKDQRAGDVKRAGAL
jgi:hypothetical protein